MQSLLDTGYVDDELCKNIKQWFEDLAYNISITDSRGNQVKPNIYYAQPLDFDTYKSPMIFIFPEAFKRGRFTTDSDMRDTTIKILPVITYAYDDLLSKLARWMEDISDLLSGDFSFESIATGGSNTTLTDSVIAKQYDDDLFNDTFKIIITGGTGEGIEATITDYDGTLGKFTFADIGAALDNTSEYCVQILENRWTQGDYMADSPGIKSGDYLINQKINSRTALGGSELTFKANKQQ